MCVYSYRCYVAALGAFRYPASYCQEVEQVQQAAAEKEQEEAVALSARLALNNNRGSLVKHVDR